MTGVVQRSASLRPILLGRTAFLYVVAVLILGAVVLGWIVFNPAVYHEWCVRYYIPSVQQRFGFRVARISVPDSKSQRLGIIEVTPGGVLDRSGFRPGDIPVDYHGGETAFCSVLYTANDPAADGYRKIDVINAGQWHLGRAAKRELEIPRVER